MQLKFSLIPRQDETSLFTDIPLVICPLAISIGRRDIPLVICPLVKSVGRRQDETSLFTDIPLVICPLAISIGRRDIGIEKKATLCFECIYCLKAFSKTTFQDFS